MHDKPVVYTCIINGKDNLQPVPNDDVEYYVFSDKRIIYSHWKHLPVEVLGQTDPRRIARRYKILSHIYFPGRVTIWVDGRVQFNRKPTEILKDYQSEICCRPHPTRNCVYQEAAQVVKIGYEDRHIVEKQMVRYHNEGMPVEYGLHETGMLIRGYSDEVERFNEAWMAQIVSGSKRDQLSFDYCRWRLNQKVETVDRNEITVKSHVRRQM